MANAPLCICCIPQWLQTTWLGILARAASADESVDTLAQHRGGKAPKGTNSIYCFKECELTTAAPETSTAAKGYRAIAALVARLGCRFEDPPSLRPILTWSRPTVRHGTGPFYCVVPINPSNQLARPGLARVIHRNWTTVRSKCTKLSAWFASSRSCLASSTPRRPRKARSRRCLSRWSSERSRPSMLRRNAYVSGSLVGISLGARDIASRHLVDHRGPRLARPALLARECGSSRLWRLCCKSDPR